MMNPLYRPLRGAAAALLVALAAAPAWATLEAEVEASLSPKVRQHLAAFRPQAMRGDYQAMRSMGLTWATEAAQEQPRARIVGCAWLTAVLEVHGQRADAGDASTRQTHCGQLNSKQLSDANDVVQRIKYATVRR